MKKILLCDDEQDVVETLCQMLEISYDDHIAVTKITDSIDALIAITETKFDLVITDYKMPKLNGIELLNNMYSIHSSKNKETPVLMVTGFAPEIESELLKDKNILVVTKPVRVDDLMKKIEELIQI